MWSDEGASALLPRNPRRVTVLVMWNWGGFASAICRAARGAQVPVAADVTMSWVSIVPRFHLCAWEALPRSGEDDLELVHLEDLR